MNFEEFFKKNKRAIIISTACVLIVMGIFRWGNPQVTLLLAGLFVAMLFSKMLVLHEYGVDASYFLLFGIVYVFGPLVGVLLAFLMGGVQVWLCSKKTPIDFCLIKDAASAVRQSLLLTGATLGIWGLMVLFGKAWVLGKLTLVYMGVLILFWILLYDVVRIILTPTPTFKVAITIAVSLFFNFELVAFFGMKYINWLGTFL